MADIKEKTKVETLNDVRRVLRDIPTINNGGCGIAALAIARWLRKSDHVRASCMIIYGQMDYETYKRNNEAQINRSNSPGSAYHIGVLIYDYDENKQMVIDVNGTFDVTQYSYANISDEIFLLKSVNECDQWNQAFIRRRFVKKIADELDIDLSDVDLRSEKEYKTFGSSPIFYTDKNASLSEDGFIRLAREIAMGEAYGGFWGFI